MHTKTQQATPRALCLDCHWLTRSQTAHQEAQDHVTATGHTVHGRARFNVRVYRA